MSFRARHEQRCPLGPGQSLPSQPSSHLLQSPEDEPGTESDPPAAAPGTGAGGPARPHRKLPQRTRKPREARSPHRRLPAAGREAGRLVIGRLGHCAESGWALRKVGGAWRLAGGKRWCVRGSPAGRLQRLSGAQVGARGSLLFCSVLFYSAQLRGSLRVRRGPLGAHAIGQAVTALGEGQRPIPLRILTPGLGR